MENENSRNTIIFMVCTAAILIFYQAFVLGPQTKQRQLAAQAVAAAAAAQQHASGALSGVASGFGVSIPTTASPHIRIDTPSLTGAIDLQGARLDDLRLKHYRVSPDPHSDMVRLLRPAGSDHAWFMQTGWLSAKDDTLPDQDPIAWTAPAGAVLTPTTPLVLTYDNGQGLKVTRTVTVDDNAMFTMADVITNGTSLPLTLRNYGLVEQQGLPDGMAKSNIVHEGAIGVLGGTLKLAGYTDWRKKGSADQASTGGWVGATEKYWLTALIPDQSLPLVAKFPVQPQNGLDVYKSGYVGQVETVAPGATLSRTTRLFAGAKTVPALRAYSAKLGIPRLDDAVDWGHFWFLTRPLFWVLEFFRSHVGNMGLSILALTVLVKLVFFPLANKSYESMSKMKKVAPQLEAIKKQNEKDPAKVQQETMALYQREKINPFMGCLPMLIQIPVFFSLYKVLTVTIEMRQAPFIGGIRDLAARDPTTIWNLFGLLPFDPSHMVLIGGFFDGPLHLGVWPLLYGGSMWLSQAMSPPAGVDPTQKLLFQFMPLMFTFFMAQFTVGLLIYWAWSNFLSILQQYVIMHRLKVDNPIDTFIGRFAKPRPAG